MSLESMVPTGDAAVWIGIGLLGQALFGARFLVQWIYSEIRGKSRVPHAFWYLSVAGGVLILAYAIHRNELPFIIGEVVTLLIFLRNVQLLRRTRE
ncbi:MAG TPA: lipid-A-disaccharide synthase N-terminal domain-containing protein [Rhodanobacteraceae bacterium]|nr:lipid-A-disaccharide synthase N-terminal domain-containing protein [Rhodanobacteraceae bacterium]